MLYSIKASCKASSRLAAVEDLLQNVKKVDSDNQQRPLDLVVIEKSSNYLTESGHLVYQVSRMVLVHTILLGLLNNEGMCIFDDDLPEYPEHVFHAYKLPKMAEG